MTPKPAAAAPFPAEARYYQVFCALAVVILFLVSFPHGALTAVLFALVGVWGVLSTLRVAPLLLLTVIAVIEVGRAYGWGNLAEFGFRPRSTLRAEDVLFCVSVLAYVVGHYRLQSLILNVLPLDPRQRTAPTRWQWLPKWESSAQSSVRSSQLVTMREIGVLVVVLPLAALAAQLAWAALASSRELFELPLSLSRMLRLAWTLVPGMLVVAAVFGVWRRRHMNPEAAALVLQDTLWRETRGEQRRLERWAAWQKLREKETS